MGYFFIEQQGAFLMSIDLEPETKHDSDEVKIDQQGMSTWPIPCLVRDRDHAEELIVKVKAKENPIAGLSVLAPLKFEGLKVTYGSMPYADAGGAIKERKWLSFWADAVKTKA